MAGQDFGYPGYIPSLKIVHIKGKDNIADGLSRIDHKIAQVAKMTPQVLDDRKPIDKAIIEAMGKWPKIQKDGYEEIQPPQLPLPTMKTVHHLGTHTTSLYSCIANTQKSIQEAVDTTNRIGKSHSTRSKTNVTPSAC